MQPRDVVIVSACRTAIGKFQGQFKDVPARALAITAGKEAIRRAGVDINTCLLYTSRVSPERTSGPRLSSTARSAGASSRSRSMARTSSGEQ